MLYYSSSFRLRRGNNVGNSTHKPLEEYLVGRLGIHHNVKHRSNQPPRDDVGPDLEQVEHKNVFLPEFTVCKPNAFRNQPHQEPKAGGRDGRDNPAPPDAPAVAEVNQRMADQADQQPGYGAEKCSHKCEQAVLAGDIGVGNRARDCHKAAQYKEECRTDADRHNGFYGIVFHFLLSIH